MEGDLISGDQRVIHVPMEKSNRVGGLGVGFNVGNPRF